MKNFYGDRRLDPRMVHPCLLQIFKKIEEDDGKYYQFLSHDYESLFEKVQHIMIKKVFFEKCISTKLVMLNNKSISHTPLFEKN